MGSYDLAPSLPSSPHFSCDQDVSLSKSYCASPVELADGRGGVGVGEEPNHTTAKNPCPKIIQYSLGRGNSWLVTDPFLKIVSEVAFSHYHLKRTQQKLDRFHTAFTPCHISKLKIHSKEDCVIFATEQWLTLFVFLSLSSVCVSGQAIDLPFFILL